MGWLRWGASRQQEVVKTVPLPSLSIGRELLAPAVEAEVEQSGVALIVHKGDKAMIASPSVVGGFSNHQQFLALLNLTGHFPIGGGNLIEHWSPISTSVRPS